MNDASKKTIGFVGVALLALLLAFVSQPGAQETDAEVSSGSVGKPMFEKFTESDDAARLRIVRFDEELAELAQFEVARDPQTGLWKIPSRFGYPADAETQMRDAALLLIDLNVIAVASEVASDHETYGVVEPDKEKLLVSASGVGLLMEMEDRKGEELARIIIGKKVKGSENQRFVRVPGQEPVFVAAIDPEKLSTEFEDWIEKDLLQLNAFDIEDISLRDYSVLRNLRGFAIDQRLQVDASFKDNNWILNKMLTFGEQGRPIPTELLDDEELNAQKLNELKTALDDLKIVDVVKKPAGLGANLKVGSGFMNKQEDIDALFEKGFFPFAIGEQGERILFSANGEVHVSQKDGVKYILRFGKTTGVQDEGGLRRYLFVTTEVDPAKIPPPVFEELPTGDAPPPPPGAAKDAPPAKKDAPPAKKDAPPAKKDAPPAKKDAPPAKKDAPPAKKDAPPANPGECQDPDTKPAPPKAEATPAAPPKKLDPEELAAERARIAKENNRKQEEYDEKLKKAQDRVRELQNRFGDWYYVISDETYRKIHLGRADLIKEKAVGENEGFGPDAFRKLQEDGLKK